MALNVTWEDHIRNVDLYSGLPRVSEKGRSRRMGLAGHCVRHPELTASQLILWEPVQGNRQRGGRQTTYVDTLRHDTGVSTATELRALMMERKEWRTVIQLSRVGVG